MLLVISMLFVVAVIGGVDQLCRSDISKRLPFYPNADLLSQEKDLLRYRAAGTTNLVFHTDDDVETVAKFYRALNLERLDKGIFRGLADIQRSYKADPEGGTIIFYRTACGT